MSTIKRSEVNKYFTLDSYPSIIDLYVDKTCVLDDIKNNFSTQNYFTEYDCIIFDNDLIKLLVKHNNINYQCFIKVIDNELNFDNVSNTFVSDDSIKLAKMQKQCFSVYMSCNDIDCYYVQMRIIALLHKDTILVYDNNQDNLFSPGYLYQLLSLNVNPIDNNLFKINYYENGWLHTSGLNRFRIKELEFAVDDKYDVKNIVSYIRNLALYMIKNGQENINQQVIEDVLGIDVITTLHNVDDINKDNYQLFNQLREYRNISDVYNHYFVEVVLNNSNYNDINEYLNHNLFYYRDEEDINNNKIIAQSTLFEIIEFVSDIDDLENLMIFARNDDFELNWYTYESIEGKYINLSNEEEIVSLKISDVYNWNYRGVIPLYSYMINE